jgi:hypothetical protein
MVKTKSLLNISWGRKPKVKNIKPVVKKFNSNRKWAKHVKIKNEKVIQEAQKYIMRSKKNIVSFGKLFITSIIF